MLPEEHSSQHEEMVKMIAPRNLMKRHFPLGWGLIALGLFLAFALVTQIQFNRVNEDALQRVRIDAFESELQAYQTAVDSHETCVATIEVRETYRAIFKGIELMFQTTADLPALLFPDSETALEYQATLTADIQEYITEPVEAGLPPKKVEDCPAIPSVKPERP